MDVPDEYRVECVKCNVEVLTVPITQTRAEYLGDPWEDQWYVLVLCRNCNSKMLITFPKEQAWERPTILWPQPNREMSLKIPTALRAEHGEARKCFNNSAYTATVVMVRRTLEGVCADNGAKGALYKALEHMKLTGLIEGRLLEWAQELRVIGNDGAHYTGRPVARQDAKDALDLAEAILNYMYVFSAQFAEFRERRQLQEETTSDPE